MVVPELADDLRAKAESLRQMNMRLDEQKREIDVRAAEAVRLQEKKLQDFDSNIDVGEVDYSYDDDSEKVSAPQSSPVRGLPAARRVAKKKKHSPSNQVTVVSKGKSETGIHSPRVRRGARASAVRRQLDEPSVNTKPTPPNSAPGIGVAEIDEVGAYSELPPSAQVRLQKVRLNSLTTELEAAKKKLRINDVKLKDVLLSKKSIEETNIQLQRRIEGVTKKLKIADGKVEKAHSKVSSLEIQVARLRQDLRTEQKKAKTAIGDRGTNDIRLNRALEELAKAKEKLKMNRNRGDDSRNRLENKYKIQEKEISLLERQRAQLLAAFRKQAKLVNVLKQQKMHIEAARLLQFTEDEFKKALDLGE